MKTDPYSALDKPQKHTLRGRNNNYKYRDLITLENFYALISGLGTINKRGRSSARI